mmetsp:Transcript_57564/g.160291  ORF Transcript_57564/g.160291 Transcript_57564/m.160291 type:complete len:339 (-) Transcript_57564:528-1544(-)
MTPKRMCGPASATGSLLVSRRRSRANRKTATTTGMLSDAAGQAVRPGMPSSTGRTCRSGCHGRSSNSGRGACRSLGCSKALSSRALRPDTSELISPGCPRSALARRQVGTESRARTTKCGVSKRGRPCVSTIWGWRGRTAPSSALMEHFRASPSAPRMAVVRFFSAARTPSTGLTGRAWPQCSRRTPAQPQHCRPWSCSRCRSSASRLGRRRCAPRGRTRRLGCKEPIAFWLLFVQAAWRCGDGIQTSAQGSCSEWRHSGSGDCLLALRSGVMPSPACSSAARKKIMTWNGITPYACRPPKYKRNGVCCWWLGTVVRAYRWRRSPSRKALARCQLAER